jgi:curved DNA-binding protein CbpA
MKTLYELLGVSADASDEVLKRAYRKRAKMYHPDLNPNDPDAPRRFRQIAAAISILCDAKRRAAYDQRLRREFRRKLDGESARYQLQWLRLGVISGMAAAAFGLVVVNGTQLVSPVSPTSLVASEITQQSASTALQESVTREETTDTTKRLPTIALPSQLATDSQGEVPARQHCVPETASSSYREGSGPAGPDTAGFAVAMQCEPSKGREADERGLSANERAALIRQAQVLLASGDAKNAHALLQRACGNSRSQCSASLRENL